MRGYQFEKLLPDTEHLPPQSTLEDEIATSQKHGGWYLWQKIPVSDREKLLAAEIVRAERETYYRERVTEFAKKEGGGGHGRKKPPGRDPLDAIKAHMGIKY